jgi:uracil-DNA glycosylase family 4
VAKRWDILRKDRVTRNDVYITNVVKRKLVSAADGVEPMNATSSRSRKERACGRHIWKNSVIAQPAIRCFGRALQALVGYDSITKARGSVFPIDINGHRVQVLATYNPAHVMREPRMEIVFRMDLNKLQRLKQGTFHVPHIEACINPTYTEAIDFLRWVRTLDTPLAYDIETMAGETACVGFAPTNEMGICINFRSQGQNHYDLVEERTIRMSFGRHADWERNCGTEWTL